MGRIVVIGGSYGEITMIGAPALAANAALRSGAGLVQLMVPADIRSAVATLSPCSTIRILPTTAVDVFGAVEDYHTDGVVLGPGLVTSLSGDVLIDFLGRFNGPVVACCVPVMATPSRRPSHMPVAIVAGTPGRNVSR